MLLYPVILDRMHKLFNGATGPYVIIALLNAALIIFMHRENIKRLLKGKENKFSFKKSEKKNKEENDD
jgi:glycerol-3-phosphate acyltransferase PlsY